MSKKGVDINGWLVIDKPKGMGSTDVVSVTRRLFNAKKNGHTGTLDPFATGVLPIAFGEATKLVPFVTDGDKEYEFLLQFGYSSTTGDVDGEIVKQGEREIAKQEILEVLPKFVGKIKQTPSKYSAIKINGERAYDLARKGLNVEMPEREVEIFALELLEYLPDNQTRFRVCCSKGTYVRSLGEDLAEALGSFGYLKELRRTRSGVFSLKGAILLENLKKMEYGAGLLKNLLPISTCLRDIAVIAVSEADAAKLKLGQGLSPRAYEACLGTAVAVLDEELVAIVDVGERKIAPLRVFNL